MEEQKKPRSRAKRVVNEGRGVEKKGEGLGTGPVGSAENDAERAKAAAETQNPRPQAVRRPVSSSGQRPGQSAGTQSGMQRPQQPGAGRPSYSGSPFSAQRPQQTGSARPAGQQPDAGRPSYSGSPFSAQRPQQTGSARPTGQQSGRSSSPFTAPRPRQTGGGRPAGSSGTSDSGTQQTRQGSQTTPTRGGGGSKLILLIIAAVVLLGGGRLSGLFGGGDSNPTEGLFGGNTSTGTVSTQGTTSSGTTSTGSYGTTSSGTTSSGTASGGLFGLTDDSASSGTGLTDLLSSFLGSSGSSAYDFMGSPASLLGGGAAQGTSIADSGSMDLSSFFGMLNSGSSQSPASYGSVGMGSGLSSTAPGGSASTPDTTVAKGVRAKYTTLKGRGRDTVTLMVYMCGADLESQNGMATSDLKEMCQASLGSKVNLIVYTGGARRWRNNVVSSSANQIYQIQDGKLLRLEEDLGSARMTDPATLTSFLKYGAKNFPADRMCLILWNHGGGSVSGYGYDERYSSREAMSLAGIRSALKNAGIRFDFIGFDTCLMATVENGLMLNEYADYLIASEETEPGVGWYYTNWLNQLGKNTSLSTLEIGKLIADDFVEVCARQCRGQGTTLSVVDLAELAGTVPQKLAAFSKDASQLIAEKEYQKVSSARSKTREFAQSSRIDQIDLVHFAKNLGTDEGKSLAKTLQSAIKYNRTGGGMTNAYGLSIYFPYKQTRKVSQAVSTYQAIGMEEEYTRCIQEFASLQVSGQVAAGSPLSAAGSSGSGMNSLLGSLLGGGGYSGGISSSASDMTDLLGGLFGGSYGDDFGFFSGRSLTAETAAEYLSAHHLDASALSWQGDRISLSQDQWNQVESLHKNVFVDDGAGYIDLGMDNQFTLEGNDLVDDFDGTWLSVNGQPVAYYALTSEDDGENYVFTGYTPALLNGVRVRLMIRFDNENPYGTLAGAEYVYLNGETDLQAKNLIQVGAGDQVQFLCDYYDYEGNYQDSYRLGDPLTLGAEVEIANTPIGNHPARVTYCFTDYYQQRYWTPARTWSAN